MTALERAHFGMMHCLQKFQCPHLRGRCFTFICAVISREEWEKTKHTRALVRVLGDMVQIEQGPDSWKLLSADHKKGKVYLGRSIVGSFARDTSAGEERSFVVDVEAISRESIRLGKHVQGQDVKKAFEDACEGPPVRDPPRDSKLKLPIETQNDRRESACLCCLLLMSRTLGKMTQVATSFGRSSTDIGRIGAILVPLNSHDS